jgi:protein-S-isoprenylcysteine O-methyltransferase Ste14
MLFYIGSGALLALGAYCWLAIKRAYDRVEALPLRIAIAIWSVDTVHFLLVLLASLYAVWPLPLNETFALAAGLTLAVIGLAVMLAGMVQFRSLRRISGMSVSGLVTTGLYRWSRNPQYAGWFIWLLGVSLAGRSGLAFLLTAVLIVAMHLYTIWLEEPYLERVLGDEYRAYKSKTARYVGIPRHSRD